MASTETEGTLKRIQGAPGVQGVIVVNPEGIPIKTTMDNSSTVQISALMSKLNQQASSIVRDLDPADGLTYFRFRTRKKEILMSEENNHLMIVQQNNS